MSVQKVSPDELGELLEAPVTFKPKKKKKKKKKKALRGKAPISIVKKSGEEAQDEINKWLASESGFLEGLTSDAYDQSTKLYLYQIRYLDDYNPFIHIDKSRQTGFSYIFAGRALARAHFHDYHTSIFISINQEEANEKIVYARGLYESLPLSLQKKLVVDNKHSIEFEAASGRKRTRTRIISHAQREPRGKGGNVDVYLDEAAHYTWGDQIYVAALPIITRGTGTMTVGSTPLGKKGIHYDIFAIPRYRTVYSYHQIYWWQCRDFVAPGKLNEAKRTAIKMSTEERVITYGSQKLIAIFITMDIDQFRQEYEIYHIDESVSFFPIDLINACVYETVFDDIFLEADESAGDPLTYPIMERYGDIKFELFDEMEDLERARKKGNLKGKLLGGYDVGRKHHTGEFSIIEELGEKHDYLQIVRFLKTFRKEKFKTQREYLAHALDVFPDMRFKIDSGGLGMPMAEDLQDYSWRVEGVDFTNPWKEEVCSDFRIRLENQGIALPDRKDVKNQIHSIKRKVTEHGKFVFDAEKNTKHHGDIFWSIAMASSLGEKPIKRTIVIPYSANDNVIPSARVIPIEQARNFPTIIKPRLKGITDVSSLQRPEYISKMHMRAM